MRNTTVGFKAGIGCALVLLTTLLYFATSSCGDCGSTTISASGGADSTTTVVADVLAAPVRPRESLEVTPSAAGVLTAGPYALDSFLATREGIGPTTTLASGDSPDSTGPDGSSVPSEGSADGTPNSTIAGSGTGTDTSTGTDTADSDTGTGTADTGADTTATTAASATTTAPPATQPATTAGPIAKPPSDVGKPPVNGQVFYVSANSGNDGNDGKSTSSPWKSLQAGIKRLSAGQTLLVMDGEYRELKVAGQVHYSIDRGGSSSNWIRIANAPGHNPVIVASNGSGILIQAPYVEVSGLTVRGSGFNKDNNWGVGISVTKAHNVRVVGNRISQMPTSGISVVDSSKFHLIGNEVFNNAFWSPLQGSGISVWHSKNHGQGADSDGYHNRIIGNRVYGNENKVKSSHKNYTVITDGNGIIIDSTQETGYNGRTLVANNLVYNNGGRGVIAWKADRVDIMFNTGYHNGQTNGIAGGATEFAAGRSNDITIANNVGWARPGLPAIIWDDVNNAKGHGNVLITDSPSGHARSGDTMHSGNPGFRNPSTDPGSADFRPNSSSVLKGASSNAPGFISTDLVGTNRRNGTPDVGAFEAEAGRR